MPPPAPNGAASALPCRPAAPLVRTVREQITDRLRHAILSGQFAAGDRLKEVELAHVFGVSRGPVRDALLQLTREGALEYRPNCGVEVAGVAQDSVRQLLIGLRRQIESYALRRVVPALDAAALAAWGETLARLKTACAADDLPAVVEHDMAFHRWVVERAGGAELTAIWLPITVRMRLVYSRHKQLWDVYPEHEAVYAAAQRGDVEAAVAAMEDNIQ